MAFASQFVVLQRLLEESHAGDRSRADAITRKLRNWRINIRWLDSTQQTTRESPNPGQLSEQSSLLPQPLDLPVGFPEGVHLIFTTLILFLLCTMTNRDLVRNFVNSSQPIGLGMSPERIGYIFGITVFASVGIHTTCFTKAERKFGYKTCYSTALLMVSTACLLPPFTTFIQQPVVQGVAVILLLTAKMVADLFAFTSFQLLVFSIISQDLC
jgi:hypothetical protein